MDVPRAPPSNVPFVDPPGCFERGEEGGIEKEGGGKMRRGTPPSQPFRPITAKEAVVKGGSPAGKEHISGVSRTQVLQAFGLQGPSITIFRLEHASGMRTRMPLIPSPRWRLGATPRWRLGAAPRRRLSAAPRWRPGATLRGRPNFAPRRLLGSFVFFLGFLNRCSCFLSGVS